MSDKTWYPGCATGRLLSAPRDIDQGYKLRYGAVSIWWSTISFMCSLNSREVLTLCLDLTFITRLFYYYLQWACFHNPSRYISYVTLYWNFRISQHHSPLPLYIEVSSAKGLIKLSWASISNSLVNNKNSVGPKIEPWGTPMLHSFLFDKELWNQCISLFLIPYVPNLITEDNDRSYQNIFQGQIDIYIVYATLIYPI